MKLKVYEYQLGDNGSYYGDPAAFVFYSMTGQWADELHDSEPVPERENFYLLVSLRLGDPETPRWIERHAKEFYELWDQYVAHSSELRGDGPSVMVQYMLWYERDRPKVDTPPQGGT